MRPVEHVDFSSLTRLELLALVTLHQSCSGKYKAARTRALRKVSTLAEEEARNRRRIGIFNAGMETGQRRAACAKAGIPVEDLQGARPVFEGEELGSTESMNFWDGVRFAWPKFRHPMRSF